jgi:hypothetical protein
VQIASQARWIQEQTVAGRRDGVFAEGGSQNVDGEVEESAGVRGIPLRPKENHRAVARERLRPGRNDERQQCDAVPLGRWTCEKCISGTEVGAAEELDSNHRLGLPANSWLTPGARGS